MNISWVFFQVQENLKEKKKMKFLLEQLNYKYSTINNKHNRFIFKIYFVVIRFCCNYQYFSLHAYIYIYIYILPTYAFIIIIHNY